MEDIIEEEEFVQEHLRIGVCRIVSTLIVLISLLISRFSANYFHDLLFIHAFAPGLDHLSENVLSGQDFNSFVATISWLIGHHDDLAHQVNELDIAILFDILDLKHMQFVDESLHQLLRLSLLLSEVQIQSPVEVLNLLAESLTIFQLSGQNSLLGGLEEESDYKLGANAHNVRVGLDQGRLDQGEV